MELMIDTNVVLDVLMKRKGHFADSALVWKLCEAGACRGHVQTLSFANMVYVMRTELSAEKIKDVLAKLSLIFAFADLTKSDIVRASEKQWKDFEYAIQCVTAERLRADYIITWNKKDFVSSSVPAVTPKEFVKLYATEVRT